MPSTPAGWHHPPPAPLPSLLPSFERLIWSREGRLKNFGKDHKAAFPWSFKTPRAGITPALPRRVSQGTQGDTQHMWQAGTEQPQLANSCFCHLSPRPRVPVSPPSITVTQPSGAREAPAHPSAPKPVKTHPPRTFWGQKHGATPHLMDVSRGSPLPAAPRFPPAHSHLLL